MTLPFKEELIQDKHIRTFSEDLDEEELVWHRDREDRLITATNVTDWQIQLDNNLPEAITEKFIPKGVYHRIIKGTGSLKLLIHKFS